MIRGDLCMTPRSYSAFKMNWFFTTGRPASQHTHTHAGTQVIGFLQSVGCGGHFEGGD